MKTLKTSMIAAVVALGTLGGAVSGAQAGNPGFGIHIDSNGNAGIYLGTGPGPVYDPAPGPGLGGKCTKFKALKRAKKMGIKNRHVIKITNSRVVVRGKKAGNKVRLVLRRKSPHCSVKNFHYI